MKTTLKQTFKWKAAAQGEFKEYKPRVVFEALEALKEQTGGKLSPRSIVEAAREDDGVLHEILFEKFTDEAAAEVGREALAARLTRSIHVTIITPKGKSIDTRAFTSVRDPNTKGERTYIATSTALDDEEGRAVLLRQAWLQLHAWRRRFADLNELAQVFDFIDKQDGLKKTG